MRLQEWTRAFLAMALLGSSGLCGRVSAEVAFVTADQWTSAGPQSVAVADFDEDGVLDVVLASPLSDTLEVRYGIGNGFFSGPLTHSVDFPFHVLASDLDLDGHADVVTANLLDGSFSFMYGDGLGHFTAVESQAIGGSPIAVAVGDFDENGVRDLAFADFSAGAVAYATQADGRMDRFTLEQPLSSMTWSCTRCSPTAVNVCEACGVGVVKVVPSAKSHT